MHMHRRPLTEEGIFSPAYYFTVGTSGNAVKSCIISAVLWMEYLQTSLISIYQTQMKLEPPSGVCQRGISVSVYFLGKAWHHSAASNYQYVLCVRWYAASLSYFFKPSNWNIRQAFENIYTIPILSYTDSWCLVHFSSNISWNHSHKVRLHFGCRIKTAIYPSPYYGSTVHSKKILLQSTLSFRCSCNSNV
jgi:hypothetical protein